MLYGMPIVSRVVAGIPDVVEQGKNGYLTESLDSDIFADYCCQIINNKPVYETMAKDNRYKAEKLFVTEVVRNRLLDIYRDCN
jgi:spore coat protein SA